MAETTKKGVDTLKLQKKVHQPKAGRITKRKPRLSDNTGWQRFDPCVIN